MSISTTNILDAIKIVSFKMKFYQLGSVFPFALVIQIPHLWAARMPRRILTSS